PPGNDHPVIAPYGVFEAKDGPFNLCAATAEMWRNLCEIAGCPDLIDHPDFADNTQRIKNIRALKGELNKAFAADTCRTWTQKLIEAGIPAGPIYSVDQVFNDPHVLSQGFIEQVRHRTIG